MAVVYIKTNGKGGIVGVTSSVFLKETSGWTRIDEGRGDRYALAQGNYFPEPIFDDNGVCRYRYADGKVTERSPEERAADVPPAAAVPDNEELAERSAALEKQAEDMRAALCDIYGELVARKLKSVSGIPEKFRDAVMKLTG